MPHGAASDSESDEPLDAEIVDLIDREAEQNTDLARLIESHNGDYSKVVFHLFTLPVI